MDLSISKTTPVAAILKLFELSATLCTAKNPVPCGFKKFNKVSKRYTLSDTIYNAIISCQFTKNVNKKLSIFFLVNWQVLKLNISKLEIEQFDQICSHILARFAMCTQSY